jgi:hypothetical protein
MLLPPAALALPLAVLLIIAVRNPPAKSLDHNSRHGDSIYLERSSPSASRELFEVKTGIVVFLRTFGSMSACPQEYSVNSLHNMLDGQGISRSRSILEEVKV